MAEASGLPSVGQLRELASTRVEATSLRQVAREIGVTAMGLRYFLDGGEPRLATRRKLEDWYVQQAALQGEIPAGEAEIAALALLERDLPARRRSGARARVVAVLEEIFDTARVPRPGWLQRARTTVRMESHREGAEEVEDDTAAGTGRTRDADVTPDPPEAAVQ